MTDSYLVVIHKNRKIFSAALVEDDTIIKLASVTKQLEIEDALNTRYALPRGTAMLLFDAIVATHRLTALDPRITDTVGVVFAGG